MGGNVRKPVTRHPKAKILRFPAFITLALSVTRCSRCTTVPVVLSTVVDGLERKLDPFALTLDALPAAAAQGRWIGVVRPIGPPIAHKAQAGHWWLSMPGHRPTLLAEHAHDTDPLPYDRDLTTALLARFLPAGEADPDPDAPPPF